MTKRREIEQALADTSVNELNEFFVSHGLNIIHLIDPTNEEERRKVLLRLYLNVADKNQDLFTKICRTLDSSPEEKMLTIEDVRRRCIACVRWLRDHWVQRIVIPLAVSIIGGLVVARLI